MKTASCLKTSTIPYTPTAPGWSSIRPRPLRPICPHPDVDKIQTPPLPSPARHHIFHTTADGVYRLTTHLVPAAYPRLPPDLPLPEIPAYGPDQHEKVDALVKQVLETQSAYEKGESGGEPGKKLLWNCVNRYVRIPTSSKTTLGTGLTLFLSHANGLHKETFETMLRSLLDAPGGKMVDEVWAWDAVQHGDAAVVNADNLSGIFDWLDDSRDIANFLMYYIPEDVEASVLPTRLPRLPTSVTRPREERGYRSRRLVVVGHSFGGCTSLRVAIDFPKLFSSLVLVDPGIHRPRKSQGRYVHRMVLSAFARRDHWSSREEALQRLQKSRFFSAWNPDVFKVYVDHALIDDAEGGVRLKTSGLQEGLSFANQRPLMETWELLEGLDERITLRWVIPENAFATKAMLYERMWRRPVNSTNVMFHSVGHLIVQEVPLELAQDISDFLSREYGSMKSHL